MQTLSYDPPLNTFVVRFWLEPSASGPRWRGQIDHVESGTSARFLDLKQVQNFIQRFGVMAERPGYSEGSWRKDTR